MSDLSQLRLEELSAAQAQVLLGGLAVFGVVYCFLGYPILRVLLGLTGFLIAGAVAAVLAGALSQGNVLAMAGALFLGGACGAMALVFLYRAGVFLVGFLGATLLGFALFFGHDASYGPVFTIFFGLAGGVLALLLERPVMKLATAAIGGWICAAAGMLLLVSLGLLDPSLKQRLTPHATAVLLGAWLGLTLFGAAFQFSLDRGKNTGK